VLWLLGAYTELVRLNSIRAQAKDRTEYFLLSRGLKLAGGGFAEFDLLAGKIDTIIETVDPANEAEVDQAVAEIKALFGAVDWVPIPFSEVLAGKNHLPANKLKLRLFKPESGFMGSGAYRAHFFGNHSLAALVRVFLREKLKYSSLALKLRRKANARQPQTSAGLMNSSKS
jgi:FADH2 O2-dependent halogenase